MSKMLEQYIHNVEMVYSVCWFFLKVQIIQKYIEIGSYFVVLILNNILVQNRFKRINCLKDKAI